MNVVADVCVTIFSSLGFDVASDFESRAIMLDVLMPSTGSDLTDCHWRTA